MTSQRGFSLVELMVAVTLVGVITALSVRLASTVLDAYREQRLALAVERSARASIDLVADAVRNASAGVPTGDARDAAGCSEVEVKGSTMSCCGGWKASSSSLPKTSRGTASLSSGMGSPPSATWKTPAVVRRSLAGLCSTPLASR